jgi:hypothetical protein
MPLQIWFLVCRVSDFLDRDGETMITKSTQSSKSPAGEMIIHPSTEGKSPGGGVRYVHASTDTLRFDFRLLADRNL